VRPGTPTPHPRLSAKELLILELLVRDNAMYGLELVAASRGQLKRGTVYVTLRAARPERWTPREDEWTAIQVGELRADQPGLTHDTLVRALHARLALCVAPSAFALLAIAIARSIPQRNKARAALAATVLVSIGSWLFVPAAESPFSAVAGAWCPDVLALILAAGIWRVSVVRRRSSAG
jgi:lipopolysaccharide export LptBFGC system permease protein LptF